MNSILTDIIKKYNTQLLKASGLNKGKKYKLSFYYSDVEREKIDSIIKEFNINQSELMRYSIHHLYEQITAPK